MSVFTSEALKKRLNDLNNSTQSIQTLSLWLIHHRKHNKAIVQTWSKEAQSATQAKKLTYMYLANDVIQNSRKKGPEYAKEFATVLKQAFENIAKECDDKTWGGLDRILNVWEERSIYDKEQIAEWKKAIGARKVSAAPEKSSKSTKPSSSHRTSGKSKVRDKEKERDAKKRKLSHSSSSAPKSSTRLSAPAAISVAPAKIVPPPAPEPRDGVIIDPDTLIRALQDLESSASSDASVREKIASFPPEVSDPSLLDKIRDKGAAEKLSREVDVACSLLSDYNSRLAQELEDRKQVSVMLATYIKNQKDLLSLSEQKLSEYKDKLKRVSQVRSELKSHLSNLPDLSLLPSVTGGLAPLPSAGDLFNIAAAHAAAYARHPSSLGSTSSASPNTASPADYETLTTPTS